MKKLIMGLLGSKPKPAETENGGNVVRIEATDPLNPMQRIAVGQVRVQQQIIEHQASAYYASTSHGHSRLMNYQLAPFFPLSPAIEAVESPPQPRVDLKLTSCIKQRFEDLKKSPTSKQIAEEQLKALSPVKKPPKEAKKSPEKSTGNSPANKKSTAKAVDKSPKTPSATRTSNRLPKTPANGTSKRSPKTPTNRTNKRSPKTPANGTNKRSPKTSVRATGKKPTPAKVVSKKSPKSPAINKSKRLPKTPTSVSPIKRSPKNPSSKKSPTKKSVKTSTPKSATPKVQLKESPMCPRLAQIFKPGFRMSTGGNCPRRRSPDNEEERLKRIRQQAMRHLAAKKKEASAKDDTGAPKTPVIAKKITSRTPVTQSTTVAPARRTPATPVVQSTVANKRGSTRTPVIPTTNRRAPSTPVATTTRTPSTPVGQNTAVARTRTPGAQSNTRRTPVTPLVRRTPTRQTTPVVASSLKRQTPAVNQESSIAPVVALNGAPSDDSPAAKRPAISILTPLAQKIRRKPEIIYPPAMMNSSVQTLPRVAIGQPSTSTASTSKSVETVQNSASNSIENKQSTSNVDPTRPIWNKAALARLEMKMREKLQSSFPAVTQNVPVATQSNGTTEAKKPVKKPSTRYDAKTTRKRLQPTQKPTTRRNSNLTGRNKHQPPARTTRGSRK